LRGVFERGQEAEDLLFRRRKKTSDTTTTAAATPNKARMYGLLRESGDELAGDSETVGAFAVAPAAGTTTDRLLLPAVYSVVSQTRLTGVD